MSWRIIYIEESDYLSLYLDNIRIKGAEREVTIPLSDINTLVIDNTQTTLSVNLINKCAELNVNIITCNHKHLPEAVVLPISGHYRASAMLRAQLDWSEEFRGHLWQRIVQMKILRQASVLHQASKELGVRDRLYRFAAETQLLDAGNCEGLAAKMYFRELFGETFLRDEENIVNAGLNYGYSILRSQIARSIVAHGLNPHIGVFHRGPSNAFNLADDIIEPFRPIVDRFVHDTLMSQALFTREHRLALIALTTKKVKLLDKRVTVLFAINQAVESIIAAAESGICRDVCFPESIVYDL